MTPLITFLFLGKSGLFYTSVYAALVTKPIIRMCQWFKLSAKRIKKIEAFFYPVRRRYDITYSLLCLALIELLINQGKIHYVFYALPFYFIISLWQNTTLYFHHTMRCINKVIHARYYLMHQVIYAYTSETEDDLIYAYIRNGCSLLYVDDAVRAQAISDLYFDLHSRLCFYNQCVRIRYDARVDYDTATEIDPIYIKKIYHFLEVKPDDPELLKEDDPVILKAKGSVRIFAISAQI